MGRCHVGEFYLSIEPVCRRPSVTKSLPVHSSKRDIEIDLYQANVTTPIELIACPETTFIRGSLESHDGARQIATVEVFVLLSPAFDRIQVHGNVLAQWRERHVQSLRATHDTSAGKGVEDEPAGSSRSRNTAATRHHDPPPKPNSGWTPKSCSLFRFRHFPGSNATLAVWSGLQPSTSLWKKVSLSRNNKSTGGFTHVP